MPKNKKTKEERTVRQEPFSVARPGRNRPLSIQDEIDNNKRQAPARETNYFDGSDYYANNYHNFIQFTSVIDSNMSVKFKAFLTQFEDQYSSEWNSEQVYGRNDPIQTFKNTTRKISLGWDTPAANQQEASYNMVRASKLIRMLYPSYMDVDSVGTINQAPLVKVKFRNFIQNSSGGAIYATIDGINFAPDLEAGFFDAYAEFVPPDGPPTPITEIPEDQLMPKLLKFSCTLTILHDDTIGFKSGEWPEKIHKYPNLSEFTTMLDYLPDDDANFIGVDRQALDGQKAFNLEEQKALDEAIAKQDALQKSEEAKKAAKKQQRQDKKSKKTSTGNRNQNQADEKNTLGG